MEAEMEAGWKRRWKRVEAVKEGLTVHFFVAGAGFLARLPDCSVSTSIWSSSGVDRTVPDSAVLIIPELTR